VAIFTGGSGDAAAVLFDQETSFDGTLINEGTIDGSLFLSDGDLELLDTSVLQLEIRSVFDFEQVVTSGEIAFGGILDISFDDGFLPATGQTFDLFDFGTSIGEFSEIRSDGVLLDTGDVGFGGSVSIVSAVPEPSSIIVIAFGSVLLLSRRRRDS